jgi:hypothetical protein
VRGKKSASFEQELLISFNPLWCVQFDWCWFLVVLEVIQNCSMFAAEWCQMQCHETVMNWIFCEIKPIWCSSAHRCSKVFYQNVIQIPMFHYFFLKCECVRILRCSQWNCHVPHGHWWTPLLPRARNNLVFSTSLLRPGTGESWDFSISGVEMMQISS